MKKNWVIVTLVGVLFLMYFLLRSFVPDGQMAAADSGGEAAYLPAVVKAVPAALPTATPSIIPTPDLSGINGSFEDGWTDLSDRVQKPNVWDINWIEVGDSLYDSTDLASGTCECKHLLDDQLPHDQKIGGSDALILDGETNYKLFGVYQSWGSELSQTVSGLAPGSSLRLTVPIRVHLHGDPEKWAAESSLWVNNVWYWANGWQMGDQNWCKLEQVFVVPASGEAEIKIRVKSKWDLPKDFFIDDIRLQPAAEPAPHQDMDWCVENPTLIRSRTDKTRR